MAIQTIHEPYVKVRENIRETPNLLDVSGTSNVGGVIVSPSGPRLSFVSGPDDILKKYTKDGTIPRNADISLINAYYLSFSGGMVLARAMNTQASQGLVFTTDNLVTFSVPILIEHPDLWALQIGTTLYWRDGKNTSFSKFLDSVMSATNEAGEYIYTDLARGYASFTSNRQVTDLNDLATKVELDNKDNGVSVSYSKNEGLVILGKALNFNQSNLLNVKVQMPKDTLRITGLTTNDPLAFDLRNEIVIVTGSAGVITDTESNSDLHDNYREFIKQRWNSELAHYVGSDSAWEAMKNKVTQKATITEAITYIATQLGATSKTTSVLGTHILENAELGRIVLYGAAAQFTLEAKKVLRATKLNFKDGIPLTKYVDVELKITNPDCWAFTFGTMAFYHGAINKSIFEDYSLKLCNSSDDIINSINGLKGLSCLDTSTDSNSLKMRISYSEGNRLFTSSSTEKFIGVDTVILQEMNKSEAEMSFISKWNENCAFGIYSQEPQDEDLYRVIVSKDEGDLFQITLDDNSTKETYTVSLSIDAVDRSGGNAYIENLNALPLKFKFFVNPDYTNNGLTGEKALTSITPKITQGFSFGNSGLDLSASAKTSCKIAALQALDDQELYDIEYLAPLGIVDLQFIKHYTMIGRNRDWFTPVDIPYNKTNPNSIKGYFLNVESSSNVMAMGPFDKNTGLTGWMNYIAASTLYYTKVLRNKAVRKEFAPCFDITNGILDYTQPVYLFDAPDRKKLLNFKSPVNIAVFDQKANVHYFNDNRTHQSEINVASEENNRRMINKIKKDVKGLMKRFKGRFNTQTTRDDVYSLINLYFSNEIMSQEYKPERYEIVCDSSNNTEDDIAANKLNVIVRVKLYNAIKFIDVLVDAFPLNVDFNS